MKLFKMTTLKNPEVEFFFLHPTISSRNPQIFKMTILFSVKVIWIIYSENSENKLFENFRIIFSKYIKFTLEQVF